jgi:outer membrane protein OmpA-like peptidoglycan-associated protein
MRTFFKIIVFFGLYSNLFAQQTELDVRRYVKTASENDLVRESSRMMQENFFFFAEIVVDKLLKINTESANYNYRKGFILLESKHDFITAIPYLEKAVNDIDKNFDAYSASEKSAPTDVLYHLGRCYHLDLQLDKARKFYQRFINESNPKSELVAYSKLKLQQCDVAQRLIQTPSSSKVLNVGEKVNSVYADYSSIVSVDGTALYLTSRRPWADNSSDEFKDPMLNQYPEDIYVSFKNSTNGAWLTPQRILSCEPELNEATIALSSDERTIYTYVDRTGNGDIYSATLEKDKYKDLALLHYPGLNTENWETHITMTNDGQEIYFVSNRPGGYGGKDIYRMVKLPDGNWSVPYNLGPTINTPYDEESAFIGIDSKTLYFASNGPMSMGEFDIFITIKDEDGNWSTPINLGYPVNSTADDFYFTTTADGLKGYLTSSRKEGYGDKDIYEIYNDAFKTKDLALLKVKIRTSDLSEISENVSVSITCLNCDEKKTRLLKPRIRDGMLFDQLDPCREYEIAFKLDSTVDAFYKTKFNTLCKTGYQENNIDVVLDLDKLIFVPAINYNLEITVSDAKTNERLNNATISFKDIKTGKIIETISSNDTGLFNSNLLKKYGYPGKKINYEVIISKNNFITQTYEWNTELDTTQVFKLVYTLEKIDLGADLAKSLNIKSIYFEKKQSDLRPEAIVELDKIVKAMNNNPSIEVEIASHTDCIGARNYNLSLSEKRAKASATYIKARISNPKRVRGKGYGESKLVNDCACEGDVMSNCTEEQHQENRRTEFKIIKY